MNASMIYQGAAWIIPLVIAIVFHEVAHGRVARYYGDTTALERGRLSFNPIRHVDPIGTVILPLILAVSGAPVFGWAKGVPVDASRMDNPRWNMVAVALAGPAMNIALMIAAAGLISILKLTVGIDGDGAVITFIMTNLMNFMAINLFLACFNLLPIPPFDGSKVLAGILPPTLGDKFRQLDRMGMLFAVAVLVIIPSIFPSFNLVGRVIGAPVIWMLTHIGAAIGVPFA